MKTLLVLLLLGSLLGPVAGLAQPAPLTHPLTPQKVACNQAQLARLLNRLRLLGPLNEVLVTYSNEHAFYEGLGVASQGVFSGRLTPEYELAFDLNPSLRDLLLNPARPPLPQISLTREDSASNLVKAANPHVLTLELNPLLSGTPAAADLLVVNNLEVPAVGQLYNGFRGTSAGPGRGLAADALLDPCHADLTPFDRRIFALLERLVRTSAILFLGGSAVNPLDTQVAIFRGEDPHTYRVDLSPVGVISVPAGDPRLAVAIRIDWDSNGRLTTGRMEVLPVCATPGQTDCTGREVDRFDDVTVRLIPPVFPGSQTWSDADPRVKTVVGGFGRFPTPVDVDFAALLAGTAWNTDGV
ncbi:MAG TPA: hypothetical protein VGR07_08215 [Thermoanaerobaculia bacterium]|jgi:hypothetical protein|nr:hypothetical protein [Thermoanaerobaculia bacterium]